MATTKFDIKAEALKPVLASVGVTDLAVEKVRDLVEDVQERFVAVQKDVTARVNDVQKTDPEDLRKRAVAAVNARVDAIAKDAQTRRNAIEARVAELQAEAKAYPGKVQTLVDENVATANATYADLVERGESLVTRIRKQKATQDAVGAAKTTIAKAKTTVTQARKAAEAEVAEAKKDVKKIEREVEDVAREVKKAAARRAPAKKAPAKKTTAKKSTAKKAPAKKAAAKKTTAKKTAAQSSAKATATAAKKTATTAVKAVSDAAEKVGD